MKNKSIKNRKGVAAIEFAFIGNLFFILLLSSFDIVGLMNAYSTLQWSVTTAARIALSDPSKTVTDIKTVAETASTAGGYDKSIGSVFAVSSGVCGNTTCYTITGTYTYKFVFSSIFCSNSNSTSSLCQINLVKTMISPVGSTT